jgi:AbrB family looped-hinge helix DNA binding protein
MSSTLLSVKGQVVIPKALRDARRWGPGTRFEVRETPEGLLLTPVPTSQKRDLVSGLAALRQMANYRGPALSVEDMDAVVLAEARRRQSR